MSFQTTENQANASQRTFDLDDLELPVLPDVATQLIKIANDPDWEMESACDLIRRDPALTSKLLQFANSPLYASSSAIESVQQCIARLGISSVGNLVLAIHSSCIFRSTAFQSEVSRSFRRSLLSAAFAEEIARKCRTNVERSFLCGLMHDIGRPTIIQAVVGRADKVDSDTRVLVAELVSTFGQAVAARLVSKWGLPDEIAQAIVSLDSNDATTQLGDTLRLAVAFATSMDEDPSTDFAEVYQHPSPSRLNLYQSDVDAICQKAESFDQWVTSVA